MSYSRIYFTVFFGVNFILAITARYLLSKVYKSSLGDKAKLPLVAIGFMSNNENLLEKLVLEMRLRVVAKQSLISNLEELVDSHHEIANKLGLVNTRELGMLVYEEKVGQLEPLISYCELNYIPLFIVPSVSSLLSIPLKTINYRGILLLGPKDLVVDGVSKRFKRILDVILAIIGIVLTSWLMAFLWVILLFDSPRHAIFSQERLGLDGKKVRIFKFRTMVIDSERQLKILLENDGINKTIMIIIRSKTIRV